MAGKSTKETKSIDLFVANRLRIARKQARMTQTNAGDYIGKQFQQVQKYERGTNRISAGAIAALAELYGKPIAWFFPDPKQSDFERQRSDIITQMLALRNGTDLAKHFLAISTNYEREIVVIVALALAVKVKIQ